MQGGEGGRRKSDDRVPPLNSGVALARVDNGIIQAMTRTP
jgi:hypothetical protein